MEENLITIERICGSRPLGQELIEIGNDPNLYLKMIFIYRHKTM